MNNGPSWRLIRALAVLELVVLVIPAAAQDRPDGYWAPLDPPKAHYRIQADIELERMTLSGRETITLVNTSRQPLSVLALDWSIGAGRTLEVILSGKPLQPLGSDQSAVLPSPLLFRLPDPLAPGRTLLLGVKFESANLASTAGREIKLLDWHPRLWWDGRPVCESFAVKLGAPSDYAQAMSGRLNPRTGFYETSGVRTMGVYLGKGLQTKSLLAGNVLITALFTDKAAACAQVLLETAADAVTFYTEWLEFYPYDFLTIIPGDARPMGGYPFASGIVVVHGQETFGDGKRDLDFWKWIVAHEIGHQYWGEYVMDDDNPAWLWIGLGLFADQHYSLVRGLRAPGYPGFFDTYLNGVKRYLDTTVDLPPAQVEALRFDHNNIVIHGKGYGIVSALDSVLGRDVFLQAYKRCLKDYGQKRMGWKDFQRVCEAESGQSLAWFFNQWARSSGYLSYRVLSRDCRPEGEGFLSTVIVERAGTLQAPIPVKAVFEDRSSQVQWTERPLALQTLQFKSTTPLADVVLDPDYQLAMLPEALPLRAEDVQALVENLAWTGSGEDARRLFQKAKEFRLKDARTWFKLGLVLFEGGSWGEAFEAFSAVVSLNPLDYRLFGSLVWMGHLKDLAGERDEAVKYYTESLKHAPDFEVQHDQFGMKIGRKWVEERLRTPFTRKK